LAVVRAQPFVDAVLSGPVTAAQLAENLRAREVDGVEVAPRLAALVESPERYWAERAKLPWN
jgi:hypothetical protein